MATLGHVLLHGIISANTRHSGPFEKEEPSPIEQKKGPRRSPFSDFCTVFIRFDLYYGFLQVSNESPTNALNFLLPLNNTRFIWIQFGSF